jgi:hypothetical protein
MGAWPRRHEVDEVGAMSVWRPVRLAGGAVAALMVVVAGVLAGTGWLYLFRGLGWFGIGPSVADSLPLLQLASFDGQPLVRVLVAWVLAGILVGVALAGVPARKRVPFTLLVGMALLLLASQGSYALARNLGLADVVFSRTPGFGPVLEALAFALGAILPGPLYRRQRSGARRGSRVRPLVGGLGDRDLRPGEHRHAAEHDRDRHQVGESRSGASA